MNRILCNFVFVFVLYLAEVSCVDQPNSSNLFNVFASQSWKMERIAIGGMNKTVEQYIVDEFNAEEWKAGSKDEKIDKNINTAIKNCYKGDLSKPGKTANYDPCNPTAWVNNLAADDSPWEWMDKLDLRELYRFKEYVTSKELSEVFSKVFDNTNYKNNDLVKAKALCGVFWVVYIDGTALAVQAFNGMLIPGQSFDGKKRIYTCLHGFSDGNKNNNVAYYFVPYGVRADGNIKKRTANNNPNYVVNKGFKVTSLRVNLSGDFEEKEIDDEFFEKSNFGQKNMYNTYDYAVAIIEEKTSSGQTLKGLLKSTYNPIRDEDRLPLLN